MPEKHIVIIHGLASKPPAETLLERYRVHLGESVGSALSVEQVHLAYWADLMGYVPPDGPAADEYSPGGDNFRSYSFLERLRDVGQGLLRSVLLNSIEGTVSRAMEDPRLHERAFAEMMQQLPEWLAGSPAQRVYGRFLPDMHRYFFGDQREHVRGRLQEKLDGLPSGSEVCLIAHSMGSIVAADLITERDGRIDMFVTMGSPLGIRVVQQHLDLANTIGRLRTRIGSWFNLYDRLDIVALDADLADDFSPCPVLDVRISNEFVNKDGDRNYHKSYGYLRCPEAGEIVRSFLSAAP